MKLCGWIALGGLICLVTSYLTSDVLRTFFAVAGALMVLPGFLYLYVLVIWHWKDRYRGKHSDLWGAIILIETSGWMKLVYLFRHMMPDMCQSGRYRLPVIEGPSESTQTSTLLAPFEQP